MTFASKSFDLDLGRSIIFMAMIFHVQVDLRVLNFLTKFHRDLTSLDCIKKLSVCWVVIRSQLSIIDGETILPKFQSYWSSISSRGRRWRCRNSWNKTQNFMNTQFQNSMIKNEKINFYFLSHQPFVPTCIQCLEKCWVSVQPRWVDFRQERIVFDIVWTYRWWGRSSFLGPEPVGHCAQNRQHKMPVLLPRRSYFPGSSNCLTCQIWVFGRCEILPSMTCPSALLLSPQARRCCLGPQSLWARRYSARRCFQRNSLLQPNKSKSYLN